MKKIPYYYEKDCYQIVEMVEKPKARFIKEGELPIGPIKTKKRDARVEDKNSHAFFRITHRGTLEISWIKYIWLRMKGLTENQILNLKEFN